VHTIAIPQQLNSVNFYYVAAVKGSSASQAAAQWVVLVNSAAGQRVFQAAGFGKP
jgi:ABC-type molybdate transport system substrate-binding protein